jgi:hypothetical protein
MSQEDIRLMPTPTDGLVEITFQQTLSGQAIDNVFYYWDPTDNPIVALSNIAVAFDAAFTVAFGAVTASGLAFDNIRARDVFGLNNDVNITPSIPSGILVGDRLQVTTCVRFDYDVQTKETKGGMKRFAGPVEAQANGDFLSAAAFTDWQTLEPLLLANILVMGTTYLPVVRGLGTILDPTRDVVNIVTGVTARDKFTTQNSRKIP